MLKAKVKISKQWLGKAAGQEKKKNKGKHTAGKFPQILVI